MTSLTEKFLGQVRPADTTAVSIYSPPANTNAIVRTIFIANTTGVAATFRIFFNNDGSTYDESTSLFWDVAIAANVTVEIDTLITMNDSMGNIAVRTDTGNALTFTVFGAEIGL